MIATVKFTRKISSLMLVSKRVWCEFSVWLTAMSSLKGWGFERRPGGFRVITPLVGFAVCVDWRGNDPR